MSPEKVVLMNVFVVVANYMSACQPIRLYSSLDAARRFVDAARNRENLEVRDCSVVGTLANPARVFTASRYDRSSDLHYFEGVYGTGRDARNAVGGDGDVLEHEIHKE